MATNFSETSSELFYIMRKDFRRCILYITAQLMSGIQRLKTDGLYTNIITPFYPVKCSYMSHHPHGVFMFVLYLYFPPKHYFITKNISTPAQSTPFSLQTIYIEIYISEYVYLLPTFCLPHYRAYHIDSISKRFLILN